MTSLQTRRADVEGQFRSAERQQPFRGTIRFELRHDCVYYTWRLSAQDGTFAGQVSRPVSRRIIPEDSDPFEFALGHALEGLRRYRINRKRAYDVERWSWQPAG